MFCVNFINNQLNFKDDEVISTKNCSIASNSPSDNVNRARRFSLRRRIHFKINKLKTKWSDRSVKIYKKIRNSIKKNENTN